LAIPTRAAAALMALLMIVISQLRVGAKPCVVKKRIYVGMLFAALAAALAVLALLASRPAMPGSWSGLRVGMARHQVDTLIVEGCSMVRMGFTESFDYPAPMLGARSYWVLTIVYDQPTSIRGEPVIVRATARFVHPLSLLSTKPRRLA